MLVLPGVLFFLLGILVPLVVSTILGFTKYPGFGPAEFIGFRNYLRILTEDKVFFLSIRNALFLGLGYIFIQHPLCIMAAILIDRLAGKAEDFFRLTFFIPSVVSVVVTVKLWVHILNPSFGLLNSLLAKLGLENLQQAWLGDPHFALPSILLVSIWIGFGYGFLFYYAGVKGIEKQLYEAALVDGAGFWRSLRSVTLPQLKPIIRVNVILAMINALKQMEIIYLSTDGGPGNSTQFIANYLYQKAFTGSQYGYANAISVLFALLCISITITMGRILKNEN